ncbi:MAG: methyltransferase [Candidatus Xenobia bacterium]
MAWYDEDYFEEDYFLLEEPTDLETIAHVAFLRSFLEEGALEVLDLACGSGRLSLALARLAHRVTGLDASPRMIERLGAEATRVGQSVETVCQDMRTLAFQARFDLVLSFAHSFGYFRDEENLAVLRGVQRSLKSGGRFLLDLANRESLLHDFDRHARRWIVKKGNYIMFRREMDPLTGRLDSYVTLLREGGLAREHTTSVRYYAYPELKLMLQQAGLGILEVYGSYERTPYSFSSPRMVVLAERPG